MKSPNNVLGETIHVVAQSLSHAQLFATPWTAVCQAFLSSSLSLSEIIQVHVNIIMYF